MQARWLNCGPYLRYPIPLLEYIALMHLQAYLAYVFGIKATLTHLIDKRI